MAELLAKILDLQCLDPTTHWFCARKDPVLQNNGNLQPTNHKAIEIESSTGPRQQLILEALQIFAYDSPEIAPQKRFLAQGIDRHLRKCDNCVIEYYKIKRRLIEKLRDEYDDEEVQIFASIFDDRDIERIKQGLKDATLELSSLPPGQRGKDTITESALLAIFEALSCKEFLEDDELVRKYLEEPFKLLQTNKRLQVTHVVPAATLFLFDSDQSRCFWAMHTWTKHRSLITKEEFDFAVRDSLSHVLARAANPVTDFNFLQRLWCGIRLIIDKLDSELITHSLRAMEVDVCRLALEHLQYDTAGLRFLIQTIEKLLSKAPKDFWDAMGAISATTFIEQVFNNPQYDKFLADACRKDKYEFSALKDMLSWIQPFMASLHISQQPAACRSVSFQLLSRLQSCHFPEHSKFECYHVGLSILTWTLDNCQKGEATSETVGRIAAAEILGVTSTYIEDIMAIPCLPVSDRRYISLHEPCIRVLKSALNLESRSLRADQETLQSYGSLPHGSGSFNHAIWDAFARQLNRGGTLLARAALISVRDLTGLERFTVKGTTTLSKEKSGFNVVFGQLMHLVCQVLECINEFRPEDLNQLFRAPETAFALISSLFSPDAGTYEAGMTLIKTTSRESARKEAIRHLLMPFFETTLNGFSWSIHRIAHKRKFAPCPRMLKTCTDILDILCDAQDGLLRTRPSFTPCEVKAVENFWEHQWEALKIIYEMTEEWSRQAGDATMMKDFCRDTMQFSEHFFEQYSVFASAINSTSVVKQELEQVFQSPPADVAGGTLLKHPSKTMIAMIKWLRLRDEYLASTSETLITKLLERLTDWKLGLPEAASDFIELVIAGEVRTILTPQQRAALARALEENLGRPVIFSQPDTDHSDTSRSQSTQSSNRDSNLQPGAIGRRKLKSSTIDLEKRSVSAKRPREVAHVADNDEFEDSELLDEDMLAASTSIEKFKLLQQARLPNRNQITSSTSRPGAGQKQLLNHRREIQKHAAQISFREKREKDNQAKKKSDAEVLAKLKRNLQQHGVSAQTCGAGSAVSDIGILGKDHAPRGTGMMVSSGSDTDSEDELDLELFGTPTNALRVSAAVKDYNSNKVQQARAHGPVKKTRQIRTAKDMRARLAPDLCVLHKTILSWDFFHNSDFPPNSDRDNYSLVTSSFRTPTEYQSTFEPLLILEAWQAFLKSKEEGYFKTFEIKVANRLTVDAFIEVSTTMDLAEGKTLGLSEADIVLMSKGKSPTSDQDQPHCFARVSKMSRKKTILEITYRVNVGNGLVHLLTPAASIYGVKIASITPLEREYGALLGLKYYDLCDEIVKAKASPLLRYTNKQIEPLASIYSLNTAQAKAVKSAIDNDAFTLVQGPPGSGKTKTIIAIVGALLTNTLRDVNGVKISRPQQSRDTNPRQPSLSTSRKLMVCAPSNAAVDELVMRLKEGIKTLNGDFHKISVVRLGRSENINANVLDVTLDELVKSKLNIASSKKMSSVDDVGKLIMDHKATCEKFSTLIKSLDESKSKTHARTPEQSHNIEVLKRRKQQLSNQIDLLRDNGHTAARDAEIGRRKVQQEILDGAHVLCATLSGSGHDMFRSLNIEFETVIIDEAAQSIELSALIPLKYGCAKCIMVGDPKQLPPTVLSREAARFQYEQSLFVRMQSNRPDDVHLLNTQYRMHPEISLFPSQAFYDGRLLDGQDMAKIRTRPWHHSHILSPYRFFDVQGTHQNAHKGHSLINLAELEVALQLFDRLITDYKGYDFEGKVGIITPYKSQLTELKARFARKYGDKIFRTIEFNTTDAFQGRESEIIIFSCVRASTGRGIGFLSDIRRMNVGITRAKSSLWVLGNSQSLMQGEFWANLIQNARERNRYTQGDIIEILQKPLLLGNIDSSGLLDYEPMDALPITNSVTTDTHAVATRELAESPSGISCVQEEHYLPDPHRTTTISTPYVTSTTDDDKLAYRQCGDNGFIESAICKWCGSFGHTADACNNGEASRVGHRCWRCQSLKHTSHFCPEARCTNCGQFGHLMNTCSNTVSLTKIAKPEPASSEAEQKQTTYHAPDDQARKQVGNHDKTVSAVQGTRRMPSPSTQVSEGSKNSTITSQKRKRQSFEHSYAPKGSSLTPHDTVSTQPGISNLTVDGGQSSQSQNHILDVITGSIPSRARAHFAVSDNILGKIGPALRAESSDSAIRKDDGPVVEHALTKSATKQSAAGGFKLPPTSSAVPPTVLSQILPLGQIRRKREIDPFIRPKVRNRRQ